MCWTMFLLLKSIQEAHRQCSPAEEHLAQICGHHPWSSETGAPKASSPAGCYCFSGQWRLAALSLYIWWCSESSLPPKGVKWPVQVAIVKCRYLNWDPVKAKLIEMGPNPEGAKCTHPKIKVGSHMTSLAHGQKAPLPNKMPFQAPAQTAAQNSSMDNNKENSTTIKENSSTGRKVRAANFFT